MQPNGTDARQPSHHLKLVSNEVARATKASIFRSPTFWQSSSELSLRLLEYLATVYPDLYRCVVHCFSTHPYNTVPFATLAYMLSKTVLDLFAPLPASSFAQPPPSPSPSGASSQTNSTTSSFLHSNSSTASSSNLFGSQTFLAPSALHSRGESGLTSSHGINPLSLSFIQHMPSLPADKGSISVHLFDGKLPDACLLLFDAPQAFEEVFCWAMYIFYYLIVEKAQILQMTRMTSILAKVSQRLKKLLSKSSKLPDFIAYAMKAVKPTPSSDNPDECGPLTAGNTAQKTALLNRIISSPYDEDGHEAIVSLTIVLDEEDRLGLGLGNSVEHLTPSSNARVLERNTSDSSPPRSKVSRKHTESPSKRKRSGEYTEQKYGFVFLRAHLTSLIGALYSANKYENRSFGVPHLRGNRLFVNSLLRLIWAYTNKVARGALDVDAAIKSLHKGGLTRSPFEPLVEHLTLENSTIARSCLDIILKCITAYGEHQSRQHELKSSLGIDNMSYSSSSVPPPPVVTSVETHISPPTKHRKSTEKDSEGSKKEERRSKDHETSSSKSHSSKDSGSSGGSKDSSNGSNSSKDSDSSGSGSKKERGTDKEASPSSKSSKKESSPPKKSGSPTRTKEPSPRRREASPPRTDTPSTLHSSGESKERGRSHASRGTQSGNLNASEEFIEDAASVNAINSEVVVIPPKPKIASDRAGRRSPERRRVVDDASRRDGGYSSATYRESTSRTSPPASTYRERSGSREFVSGYSPTRNRKKTRTHSSKDSASSPPATALRSDSMTRSDSSSSVSSTSSSKSSSRSSFSSIQNYWSQYTATSISQFEKLLDCDIVGAVHPHFSIITRNVLPLAITLQSFVMSRVEEFTNAFLVLDAVSSGDLLKKDSSNDLTRSDSSQRSDMETSISASGTGNGLAKAQTARSLFRIFNNFWNKFMGEGCIALTSIVSKQWLLLGFEDEDPTKVIKNQWPIRVLRFLSEHISPPERFDDLVMPRLMRKTEDYDIAIVFIELCQLVVTVTKDAIGETKNSLLPVLLSHSYALEFLSTEILFVFDTVWTSQKLLHNDPLNVQRVMKHLRRHLLLALLTEPTVERVILVLKASVSVFDIHAIDDPSYGVKSRKNPIRAETHFSFLDAIEDSYEQFVNERNMEIARIEAEKRRKLRRRSSTGGKRKSNRSASSTNTAATTSTDAKPSSSKSHRSSQRRHRKNHTSSSVAELPPLDPPIDTLRLIPI